MRKNKFNIDDVVCFYDDFGNYIIGKIQCIIIPDDLNPIEYYIGYGLSRIREDKIFDKLS